MTQTLYLLRHAKAKPWDADGDDFSRALSAAGEAHMSRLRTKLRDLPRLPEKILCSPARRTRETLEPLMPCWPGASLEFAEEIYGASTGMLYSMAQAAFQDHEAILMVGHNPGFESLLMALLRHQDSGPIYKMPTGTFAGLEFSDSFEDDAGNAVLRHWITRKNLSGD